MTVRRGQAITGSPPCQEAKASAGTSLTQLSLGSRSIALQEAEVVAVLAHEGTYPIMYGRFAVPVGSGYRPGYLARPDRVGQFPTVIVVPGIDGLSSFEKDICRRFARRGLATLSFELYRQRMGDPLVDYARLSDRMAITDLDEVGEFLASDDVSWSHSSALGILGLDVGGRFALALAAQRRWIRAAAVCSSPLTGDEEREIVVADLLAHIAVPVLGLYGAEDALISADTVDEAQARNQAGQWLLYAGAGHGFLNISDDTYDADAAADAEARLITFFLSTLPANTSTDLG